ncbi:flagellum-specific peptidoglycan hydrolase FlgJ [Symbiobacterium terraclitae]|uniref:Flagellum-specific peptidoglycan hydrolase FlgJ n=1 Tax=Symbiobacterium terraclitae TaxID=557451 RepID=A0ABS4JVK7_9FIRM|nr:flagellum-specific peptidoglycan hydrolase FlgJ [Symbiobacterium terraclitae]
MNTIDWAVSVKPDLVRLQRERGIPALFAAAQMCHESYNTQTGGLTELASKCHNYAGMKWAPWQAEFGAYPVVYGTWEHIDGSDQRVSAAFAAFPSWEHWLRAYASLLTADRYRSALQFAADPLLYGLQVWQYGWATDPNYAVKLGLWMAQLWSHYADTLQGAPAARTPVPIRDAGGRLLTTGWLDGDRTAAYLRELAEAMGQVVDWQASEPAAIVRYPGRL